MNYQIKSDAPDYLIGYGPYNEFCVAARTSSLRRAYQICRLLNAAEGDGPFPPITVAPMYGQLNVKPCERCNFPHTGECLMVEPC